MSTKWKVIGTISVIIIMVLAFLADSSIHTTSIFGFIGTIIVIMMYIILDAFWSCKLKVSMSTKRKIICTIGVSAIMVFALLLDFLSQDRRVGLFDFTLGLAGWVYVLNIFWKIKLKAGCLRFT